MNSSTEYLADGTLVLKNPVELPEIVDLLVVGGGPAGTAAAFHARELGLSALVIDYDDLMKRIRDYPKDKLILPDFGGGDGMKFPKGGELVSLLRFGPIDKDEMVSSWKGYYRENNIPAQIGIELLGLDRQSDGVWRVKTWNHNTKAEQLLLVRHIAISIGRGVPRRFDIPGNTDGVAYRLSDALSYVNKPALVIGGGTSAAEAVISISHAKAKAGNNSAVYWSYRGDKLPKVSKALADVFFEAYLGNGNIRYFPNSDPVAVVTAGDSKEYLSLRTDRKMIDDRPNETLHLEFLKECCIACIGEDIPEGFLNSLGIFMATGGPTNKKRMVVNQVLETQQPSVYLIGDILSQAYLETDNFSADPATFREIKHRGNIKAGLRDGVLVAKVVSQKIAGKKEFDIELDFEESEPKKKRLESAAIKTIFAQATPGVKVVEPEVKKSERVSSLIRILPGGVQEEEFQLKEFGITTIGRKFCDIVFPEDELLSERHASVSHDQRGYLLGDDGGSTGVFFKAPEGVPLEVGADDLIRLGRQFLLFQFKGGDASFTHYNAKGEQIEWYPLTEKTMVIGREAPDITLDPSDTIMSRRHVSVAVKEGKIVVKDLKSLNGTFLKVREPRRLGPGDKFRVGKQLFMLSLQQEPQPEKIRVSTRVSLASAPTKVAPVEQPARVQVPVGDMIVTVRNGNKTLAFQKGQTICDIAEKNGVKIVAECHAGICGSDPIRIHAGGENLNPITPEEKGTLEDICGLTPGECRLACMVRPAGSVEIDIVG